jgi:hypothetical protein
MTLFANQASVVQELRRDRLLVVARTYFPDVTPASDYLYKKILSAEREVQRRLRVHLEPVTVLPEGGTQAERDALEQDGQPWIEEPGYDLEKYFFSGDTWGFIQLRQRPVIEVTSIKFVYPLPASGIFTVPNDWIRLDKKYGHLRMVPSSNAAIAPLNIYVMQAISGGRMFPQMVHVRYRAGLQNVQDEHPDIIDIIKKIAVVQIIDDMYLPQSGSQSIDGMSQSLSMDSSKYSEKIDDKIEVLRQSIHGIRMGVL